MVKSSSTRRGRPPKFVRDGRGKEMHGLSALAIRKGKGEIIGYRYYATFSEPRVWFGSDRDLAIMRFRAREATLTRKKIAVGLPMSDADLEDPVEFRRRVEDFTEFEIDSDGTIRSTIEIPENLFWSRAREVILNDPKAAAQRLGIPEIGYLDQLKPPPPSAKLASLGEVYFQDKTGVLTPKELANSKTWWIEFCSITGAATVKHLSREAFRKYR